MVCGSSSSNTSSTSTSSSTSGSWIKSSSSSSTSAQQLALIVICSKISSSSMQSQAAVAAALAAAALSASVAWWLQQQHHEQEQQHNLLSTVMVVFHGHYCPLPLPYQTALAVVSGGVIMSVGRTLQHPCMHPATREEMPAGVSAAAVVGYRRLLVAHACSPHDSRSSRSCMGGDQPQVIYTDPIVSKLEWWMPCTMRNVNIKHYDGLPCLLAQRTRANAGTLVCHQDAPGWVPVPVPC